MKFIPGSIDPRKKGWKKFFGELEASILEIMWKLQNASVQDVLDNLPDEKDLAYTTVMTVMDRLSKKGLLEREKQGRKFIYTPSYSKKKLEKKMFNSLFTSLLKDWGKPALAHFIDSVSKEDIKALDELEQLIESKRETYEEE